jgi:hypothetical protein
VVFFPDGWGHGRKLNWGLRSGWRREEAMTAGPRGATATTHVERRDHGTGLLLRPSTATASPGSAPRPDEPVTGCFDEFSHARPRVRPAGRRRAASSIARPSTEHGIRGISSSRWTASCVRVVRVRPGPCRPRRARQQPRPRIRSAPPRLA